MKKDSGSVGGLHSYMDSSKDPFGKITMRQSRKAISVMQNNGIHVTMNPITGHTQKFANGETNDITHIIASPRSGVVEKDLDFDPVMVGDPLAHVQRRKKAQVRIKDNKGLAQLIASQGDANIDIESKYAELIKNFGEPRQASMAHSPVRSM